MLVQHNGAGAITALIIKCVNKSDKEMLNLNQVIKRNLENEFLGLLIVTWFLAAVLVWLLNWSSISTQIMIKIGYLFWGGVGATFGVIVYKKLQISKQEKRAFGGVVLSQVLFVMVMLLVSSFWPVSNFYSYWLILADLVLIGANSIFIWEQRGQTNLWWELLLIELAGVLFFWWVYTSAYRMYGLVVIPVAYVYCVIDATLLVCVYGLIRTMKDARQIGMSVLSLSISLKILADIFDSYDLSIKWLSFDYRSADFLYMVSCLLMSFAIVNLYFDLNDEQRNDEDSKYIRNTI